MSKTKEEARASLIAVVSHLSIAAEMAKVQVGPGGTIKLAIVSQRADGSGSVGATFEAEEFCDDLVRVLDDPELKELYAHRLEPSE